MSVLGAGVTLVGRDFDSHVRQFYLRAARHALPVAPIREFRIAIEALEKFDGMPTPENLASLVNVYEELCGKGNAYRGYTSIGQFYRALIGVLEATIEGVDSVSSSDVVHFCEARWLAEQPIGSSFVNARDEAFRRELHYQDNLYAFLFNGAELELQ
jgi:hypothetical protein